jgi:hypothetical protein
VFSIEFCDWIRNRPKEHRKKLSELRVFELLLSEKMTELVTNLGGIDRIVVYFLANSKEKLSYDVKLTMGEVVIYIPDDFMIFIDMKSTEEKFQHFSKLIYQYVIPALEEHSDVPSSTIYAYIEEALDYVVKENYEAVFLVDKTPKKSPSRKRTAILKGIHRSEGFQLRCEVYSAQGRRVIDQLLVEEIGNEFRYARFLGTLRWESENHIVVKSKTSSWMAEVYI